MDRKEEYRKPVGDSLSKEQFDLDFEILSAMKDTLAQGRAKHKRIPRIPRRVVRKAAPVRRSLLEGLEHSRSRKKRELSRQKRKKYMDLLREIGNEN